jgi:hypothetical protein
MDVPSEVLSLTFVKSFITASVLYLTFVYDLTLLVSGTASNLSDSLATSLRLLERPLYTNDLSPDIKVSSGD